MPKLRALSGQDVLKIFARFGFERIDQEGSHVKTAVSSWPVAGSL
jgi:predicted RNA binding protein YcfA (HicA-like mRNA interferase family)